jgi:transcriptional regulator with XRE-family HTH domain
MSSPGTTLATPTPARSSGALAPELRFSVSDVARLLGCSASTLRAWEGAGLVSPSRSRGGHRAYTEADVARLREVAYLARSEGLNLAAIRRVLGTSPALTGDPPGRVSVGDRLRSLRRAKGMTLDEVARATGLSRSFLSMVERGQSGTSMVNLRSLLTLYGTTVAAGLVPQSGSPVQHTHPGGRPVLDAIFPLTRIEQLATGAVQMEAQLFRVDPGGGSDSSYAHEGEEFIYVIEGAVEVVLDGATTHRLDPGDCLYFASTTPHTWRNHGQVAAVMIWVNTPPSF